MSEPGTSTGIASNSIRGSSSRSILQATSWLPMEEVEVPEPPSTPPPAPADPSPDFGCVCCECDACYTTQWELLRHVRSAHPGAEVAFVCWHCGREFGKFYRLIRHVVQGHASGSTSASGGSSPTMSARGRGSPEIAGASTTRSPPREQLVALGRRLARRDAEYVENVDPEGHEPRFLFHAVAKRRPLGQSRLVNS